MESLRFYEVAPFVVRTDEYWQELAFMTNATAYSRLPQELKDALLRAHKEVGAYNDEQLQSATAESDARMAKDGAKFSTLDTGPVVKKTREFYDAEAKAGRVPKGFFETVEATRKE